MPLRPLPSAGQAETLKYIRSMHSTSKLTCSDRTSVRPAVAVGDRPGELYPPPAGQTGRLDSGAGPGQRGVHQVGAVVCGLRDPVGGLRQGAAQGRRGPGVSGGLHGPAENRIRTVSPEPGRSRARRRLPSGRPRLRPREIPPGPRAEGRPGKAGSRSAGNRRAAPGSR